MKGIRIFLAVASLACGSVSATLAHAQVLEREVGAFDVKLGSTPTRSMAQGLVQPNAAGTFHGGLDLTHDSGWYLGQWVPNAGLSKGATLQMDSYLGFKHAFSGAPVTDRLGYELGMIRYSHPDVAGNDSNEFYAGLTMLDSRFGAAFSNAPGRFDSTLYADLGMVQLLGFDMTLKYGNHALDAPILLSGGEAVRVFNDWSLNFSRSLLGFDVDLSYSSSSLEGAGCDAYSGHNARCESQIVLKTEHRLF
jgi:uncharacterized protein (TIGR02001 family)